MSTQQEQTAPTDKWAAEKAAHAQGKKIECRYKSVLDKPWETTHAPSWVDEFEYRIAPDPTPAGKLSDELPDIDDVTSNCCTMEEARQMMLAAFDKVGAKQAEEIARLTAELASLQRSYEGERHCSGERMAQILELKCEVDRVTEELEIYKKIRDGRLELQAKYDDLQVTMDSVTMNANWSIERMKGAEHKLATLEARLGEIAALPEKWRARPAVMSWNPAIDCIFELEAYLLPEPTEEAVSKADFERFARGEGYSLAKNAKGEFRDTAAIHGWKLWQAARAAKEVQA